MLEESGVITNIEGVSADISIRNWLVIVDDTAVKDVLDKLSLS